MNFFCGTPDLSFGKGAFAKSGTTVEAVRQAKITVLTNTYIKLKEMKSQVTGVSKLGTYVRMH